MSYKGRYTPINPSKYKGDPTKIYWRSSWELQVMKWLDYHSSIVEWSSEETIIPYKNPLDQRLHRYFPDFKITVNRGGIFERYIVEVKPKVDVKPKKGKKTSNK